MDMREQSYLDLKSPRVCLSLSEFTLSLGQSKFQVRIAGFFFSFFLGGECKFRMSKPILEINGSSLMLAIQKRFLAMREGTVENQESTVIH